MADQINANKIGLMCIFLVKRIILGRQTCVFVHVIYHELHMQGDL